jgi:hypothetical protein
MKKLGWSCSNCGVFNENYSCSDCGQVFRMSKKEFDFESLLEIREQPEERNSFSWVVEGEEDIPECDDRMSTCFSSVILSFLTIIGSIVTGIVLLSVVFILCSALLPPHLKSVFVNVWNSL